MTFIRMPFLQYNVRLVSSDAHTPATPPIYTTSGFSQLSINCHNTGYLTSTIQIPFQHKLVAPHRPAIPEGLQYYVHTYVTMFILPRHGFCKTRCNWHSTWHGSVPVALPRQQEQS